jgi:hypothetical protein
MALTLQARPLPLLKRQGQTLLRACELTVRTAAPVQGALCRLRQEGNEGAPGDALGQLGPAANTFRVFIREPDAPRKFTFGVTYAEESAEVQVAISPARRWTVFLVLHSHTDLGFTAPVSVVAQIHNRNTDRAIELCRQTAGEREGEAFKWTCEVTWQIQNYLRDRSRAQVGALMDLVRSGAIEIGGLYSGEHTDVLGDEQLVRSLSYAGWLRREFRVPLDTVLLSDVPGCTAGFVQVMAKSGIRNFLLADNNFIAPFLARTDLPRPFVWEGADGTSVLCWYTDHPYYAYIEGELYGFTRDTGAVLAALPEKLLSLESSGYPYASLQIQYAFDNAELDSRPADVAREWNSLWEYPRIRIATPREFFEALRRQAPGPIPSRRGDWTSWWSSNATAFPVEAALTRNLHDRLPLLETITTLTGLHGRRVPDAGPKIDACFDGLLAFDEHSGGGSVWRPSSAEEQDQAVREGFGFLYDVQKGVELLEQEAEEGLREFLLARTEGGGDVVINLLPWSRSGTVRLPSTQVHARVPDIPPYGFRLLLPEETDPGSGARPEAMTSLAEEERLRFENPHISLSLDRVTGRLESFRDVGRGRELLRKDATSWGVPMICRAIPPRPVELGKFIPEIFNGTPGRVELVDLSGRGEVHCELSRTDTGGAECVIRRSVGGEEWCVSRISLEPEDARLVLETRIKRRLFTHAQLRTSFPEIADRESCLYLPLGFDLPDARILYESPAMVLRLPGAQFAGSCMDFYAVQHWIAIASPAGALAVATPDAPIIDIGSPGILRFKSEPDADRSMLYIRLVSMHEIGSDRESPYSRTEDLVYRFAFQPLPGSLREPELIGAARRVGWEMHHPLRAVPLGSAGRGSGREGRLLRLEPDNVQLVTMKRPSSGGGVLLRVMEKQGVGTGARFSLPGWRISGAWRTTLTEEVVEEMPVADGALEFKIEPHGIETFLLKLEPGGTG